MDEKTKTELVQISVRGPMERNACFGRDAGWSRPRAGTEHKRPYRTWPGQVASARSLEPW
jgi:hypothetical protein